MNYSEVKELLQAGFTAEEIRGMLITHSDNPQNPQDNPQDKEPDKEPAKEPDKEPAKEPDKEPDKDHDDSKFDQLNSTMEKILKSIQSANLNNNSFDKKEADIDTQVDKIMAGIIRPEREKGGN